MPSKLGTRRRLAGRAALVVGVTAAVCAAGLPWAQARTQSPPPSAHALLLARRDLGSGWSVSGPAPRTVPALACAGLHLRLRGGQARPLQAASPTFAESPDGPFFGQTAYVYANATDERQVWRGVARPALLTCLSESLVQGGGHGVRFSVVSQRKRPAPRLAVKAASYALQATGTSGTQSTEVYLDVLVLADSTGITELSFSSVSGAPPTAVELRLARAAARRLASLTGGRTGTG